MKLPTSNPPKRRANLPIGTIRIRNSVGAPPARVIKVASTGRTQDRWMGYARWWWLKNKGPIPAGLRVLHQDGDTLNDDPENLILGTAADNVFLAHERDPKMSERNFASMRRGTAEHNRLRSRIRRQTDWLDSRWYPVDHAARLIHNKPQRNRYLVWPAMGFDVPVEANGEGADAAALGWPGQTAPGALILDVLCDGERSGDELRSEVDRRRALAFDTRLDLRRFYCVTHRMSKSGMLQVIRRGKHPALYRITHEAKSSRGAHTNIVPVLGKNLRRDQFDGYERTGDIVERRRVTALESLQMLAQAITEQTRRVAG